MDLTAPQSRQALTEWRDEHVLAALALCNARALEARTAFDAQIAQANLVDSVWDPAGFADARIDRLMIDRLAPALPDFLAKAGQALAAIGPGFAVLGEALAAGDPFALPEPPALPDAPPSEDKAATQPEAAPAASGRWAFGETLMRRAVEAGGRAAEALREAGTLAERNLQQRTGLDDRLRAAAGQRIATRWMGSNETPPAVLAQLLGRIDEAAFNARMTTL